MATPTLVLTPTLAVLQQLFPGVLLLDSHSAATALSQAYKTLNNQGDNWSIPAVRFGGKGSRKYYRLVDIAAYIDSELGISTPAPASPPALPLTPTTPAPRRQRGRPRKVGV